MEKAGVQRLLGLLPGESLRFVKHTIKTVFPTWAVAAAQSTIHAFSPAFGVDPFADMAALVKGYDVPTILDIGANRGDTVLEFVRRFPGATVHCFEPYPGVFRQLQKATQGFANVRASNIAVGERNSVAQLFLNKADVTNSLLKNEEGISQFSPAESVTPVGSVNVSMVTLDRYCAEYNVERINVLKIDSQGYELNILRGACRLLQERRIDIIYLELLFVPLYQGQAFFEDLYAHLKLHQYKLVGLYNRALHTDKSLKWCDGLFVAST
jgi:FkbM family methyltransferase